MPTYKFSCESIAEYCHKICLVWENPIDTSLKSKSFFMVNANLEKIWSDKLNLWISHFVNGFFLVRVNNYIKELCRCAFTQVDATARTKFLDCRSLTQEKVFLYHYIRLCEFINIINISLIDSFINQSQSSLIMWILRNLSYSDSTPS